MRSFRIFLTSLVAGASLPAYELLTDPSGIAIKWYDSPVAIEVGLSSTRNLSDGQSQASAVIEAMELWNAQLATIQLHGTVTGVSGISEQNDRNEIVMSNQVNGEDFRRGPLPSPCSGTD